MAVTTFLSVILDDTVEDRSPDRPLPDYVRRAGYFLNTENLKIGDLILTTPIKDNSISRLIKKSQAKEYELKHSVWTHIAIYVGDGNTCEATRKGVVVKNIYDHLEVSSIKIIRLKGITEHQRYVCAIKALQRLSKPYNYREIAGFAVDRLVSSFKVRKESGFKQLLSGSYTCSGMIYEVFLEVLRTPPFDHATRPSPADFSASNKFELFTPTWFRLPQDAGAKT